MLAYSQRPGTGTTGYDARLGKWVVGWVGWSRSVAGDPPYGARCVLPGMNDRLGQFETLDAAKVKLEEAVKRWLEGAGAAVVHTYT
jgi:hypothetical protein